MTCDSKELIVDYLYDELSETDRRSFDAHLAVCSACREEVDGLRTTRQHLKSWAPPEPEFAFRIVREQPAKVLPMRRRLIPAFGLAAAAALVIAVASAIANLEVRYDANGFVVRTGWGRTTAGENSAGTVEAAFRRPDTAASPEFQALDRRLRELELARGSQPSTLSGGGIETASARMSDTEMLRRVREIIGEAEARQQTAVAERLLQVVRDFDRQREADLAAIQRGINTLQGVTNAEIAQNRDLVNQLYRVAARQEK